jgi:hypothetical protein
MDTMGENSLKGAMWEPMNIPAEDDAPAPKKPLHEAVTVLAYFSRTINGQISDVFHRIKSRESQRLDADMYDPEMEDELQAEADQEDAGMIRFLTGLTDNLVLGELSRSMHIMFKTHPVEFLPFFHRDIAAVSGMLHSTEDGSPVGSPSQNANAAAIAVNTMSNQAKQWAICVFDDMIEFCGADVAWEMRSAYWDALVQGELNTQYFYYQVL